MAILLSAFCIPALLWGYLASNVYADFLLFYSVFTNEIQRLSVYLVVDSFGSVAL